MRVMMVATSLDVAYGGPAYSVSQLAYALSAKGISVSLWANDAPAWSSPLVSIGAGLMLRDGPLSATLRDFGPHDVVHDNGLWRPHNHEVASICQRRGVPRVVSTRGMLRPWARRHKGLKKAIAWIIYQRRDLHHADALHATSEDEAAELRTLGLTTPIRVIRNGVELPAERTFDDVNASPSKFALFLGRLYPVKGLPMLIDAWAEVRPPGWRLRIAGPDEAGHLSELETRVRARGLSGEVEFLGQVDGSTKTRAYRDADLVVLPTRSESFGMIVAEALAHGVPVLTTDAAPWPELEERQCGWRVPPTVAGLIGGLRTAMAHDESKRREMGMRGRRLIEDRYSWSQVAEEFIAFYEEVNRSAVTKR